MPMTAFRGATAYEMQIGPLWLKLLRPAYWCRGNLWRLVTLGWSSKEGG